VPIPPRYSSKLVRSKPDAGIGDWFVYDGEVLSGPHSDDDLAAMSDDPVRRRNLQVSREGFNRWYAIDELNKMLTLSRAPLKRENLTDTSELREYFDKVSQKLDRLGETSSAPIRKDKSDQFPASQLVDDSLDASSELQNFLNDRTLAAEAIHSTSSAKTGTTEFSSKAKVEAKVIAGQSLPSNDFAHFLAQATFANAAEAPKTSQATEVDRWDDYIPSAKEANVSLNSVPTTKKPEYIEVKSKLRLGTRLNPYTLAFFALPLTLGIYVTSWYRTIVAELLFHVSGEYKNNLPDAHLSWLPGAHFVAFYRLARLVREVERQNGYSSTKPWLIVVAACFPPLAVFLIQSAVNRHWNLHFTSQCKTG